MIPTSRSSRLSPTQQIGIIPLRMTAFILAATVSSSSPNNRRRSEWPTITYSTCSLASMRELTSPVNAPASSTAQFCAPSATGIPSPSSTLWTERMSVKGGCTEMSTRAESEAWSRRPRSRAA